MADANQAAEQELIDRLSAMEAEFASLRDELEHSSRLATVGVIAAGAAHEINNLLTPALAYAQLAKSREDDPAFLRKALDRSVAGIQSAAQILDAILGFSAPPREEKARTDVESALEAALDCVARDPAKDGIEVIHEIEPQTFVAIQPVSLLQVLLNLILNARRVLCAHRHGDGCIWVSTEEREDGRIRITVADNGPGIPDEIAETLFDPFVSLPPRGENEADSAGNRPGGSGLGLSVCRRTVEAAGGGISVQSRSGRGAVFTVDLPKAKETAAHQAA